VGVWLGGVGEIVEDAGLALVAQPVALAADGDEVEPTYSVLLSIRAVLTAA